MPSSTPSSARARLRRLSPRAGHDFASNDYLGFAHDPAIAQAVREAIARGVPVGSGGSRLLRGNAPEHEALEAQAAAIFGSEAALFMANGFAANAALLSALPGPGDLIVADAFIHASAHDGMKLGRARVLLPRITIRRPLPMRLPAGGVRAARGGHGSWSRHSIRWTATSRRSMHWRKLPRSMTPC